MANKEEKYRIINDMFQNIFKVIQNEKITGASTSEIKAAVGDGKWFIKIPGLCRIVIRQDEDMQSSDVKPEAADAAVPIGDESNVGFNAPVHKPVRKPRIEGDRFINDVAREYE